MTSIDVRNGEAEEPGDEVDELVERLSMDDDIDLDVEPLAVELKVPEL